MSNLAFDTNYTSMDYPGYGFVTPSATFISKTLQNNRGIHQDNE
jgi:hypothetical protein